MIYAIWSDKAGGWLNDSSGRIFEFRAKRIAQAQCDRCKADGFSDAVVLEVME